MTRICAALVIICAPCPVLRTPHAPVPVGVVVTFGPAPVVSTPRLVQATKRATAVTGRVATTTVTRTVPSSHPPRRPLRATRTTLSHQKQRRAVRTSHDFPHTHSGLVRWLRTLPDRNLAAIAVCEAVRDDSWSQGARSWARGVWQVIPSTARSLGISGDPAALSWRQQYAAARRLEARDGLRAWDCWRFGLVAQ